LVPGDRPNLCVRVSPVFQQLGEVEDIIVHYSIVQRRPLGHRDSALSSRCPPPPTTSLAACLLSSSASKTSSLPPPPPLSGLFISASNFFLQALSFLHSAVQCSAVQCSAVQCSAVQCSAVQCSAVPTWTEEFE
jgi:hypothetical protein